MLTGDLVRPRLRRHGSDLKVELVNTGERRWLQTAQELIALFRSYTGRPYREWTAALEDYLGDRLDYVVVRGLAKVLQDGATFNQTQTAILPTQARERLFASGPVFSFAGLFGHPTREAVLDEVAVEAGISREALELALFADRPQEYLMVDPGPEWTPERLLIRYNLELARGVLYWASEMRVEIHDNYKDFWRYLKLFKLMFEAAPLPEGGYRVTLDGPVSPFVSATTRYGRQFAAFLPALLLGKRWSMTADILSENGEKKLTYALDHNSPLVSHFKGSGLFDSRLEADFAAEFEEKFGDKRGGWLLSREDEVVLLGDTVMIPDFAFTHKKDGRRALLEIVGFWHPDYLKRKVQKVRKAGLANLVLLVYEGVNLSPEKLAGVPGEVLYFPNKPVIKDVMAAIENCAAIT